jgi:predicted enzyme related to lactoylglutathione lyase
MKKLIFILLSSFLVNFSFCQSIQSQLVGVKIKVPDLQKAKQFYCAILHFEIDKEDLSAKTIWLKTNSYQVILTESKEAVYINEKGYGSTSLSMQINNLDSTFSYLKSKNVAFVKEEKRLEGIGYSIHILDPFGNPLSLDQLTYTQKRVIEPALYNCGIYVSDIDQALKTYTVLGFLAGTRKYMPEDMPLVYANKKFAFMLHQTRKDMPNVQNPNMSLVLSVASQAEIAVLKEKLDLKKQQKSYILTDETGVQAEIIVAQ